MRIESRAFHDGGEIPINYTCDGKNISPPLNWVDVPEGTKELALTCEDIDAPIGTITHWVLYGSTPDWENSRKVSSQTLRGMARMEGGASARRSTWVPVLREASLIGMYSTCTP